MSICSNSVRALSRSRIPQTKTLLPFLYQTPTIQQWQSATRPIARRNITSRSRPYVRKDKPYVRKDKPYAREDKPYAREDIPYVKEDIPFVDQDSLPSDDLPPAVYQPTAGNTTITRTERTVFRKLYRKFEDEERQQKKKDYAVELDPIADEYYEDEDKSKPSLDQVFNQVLKGETRLRALRTPRTRIQATKEHATDAGVDKAQSSKKKDTGVDTAKLKELRLAERERIDKLIRNAPTDRALWQILEHQVFNKVRDLDLDNANGGPTPEPTPKASSDASKKSSKTKPPHKPDAPSTDARILFQNYPFHLITAIHTLRTEFPSSPLPFAILPTIKKLGRSSHALGATTTLYKHLIRTAWIQQCSYTTINMLLSEMDDNAIEFDADILGLLDAIIKEHNTARSSALGREIALVYGMQMFLDGLAKLASWRNVVAERLGLKSEEKRAASALVRRTTHPVGKDGKVWRGVSYHKREGNAQQKDGAGAKGGGQDYAPLVEGVNPGLDGSLPATDAAKDGEEVDSASGEISHSQQGDERADSKPAQVLL